MAPRFRLALIAAFVAVIAISAASATSPGKNGRIAFKRYLDSGQHTGAIFVVNSNGTAAQQVTRPATGQIDDQPDWSPDGSLIVFHRQIDDGPWAIYTVKPDGSELTRLSPPCTATGPDIGTQCEDGTEAHFLPDGQHVIYTRSTGPERQYGGETDIQHSDLVVRDIHSDDVRVVLRAPDYAAGYFSAVFSPDGSRLVYVRENSAISKPAHRHAVFVASANGGTPRQITPWALDAGDGPDWSPDGKWILFRSYEGGAKQSQIYIVRPNGTGLRSLTHFAVPTQVLSASYSPDGKWITVAKTGVGHQPDVFVMRANGTGIRPVTRTARWDSAPDWGSAG